MPNILNLLKDKTRFHYICDDPKGFTLKHGRCWFDIDKIPVNIEWKFGDFYFNIGINHGAQEYDLQLTFCVPWIKLFLSLDNVIPKKYKMRLYENSIWNGLTTDLRIFDWAIWWNIKNNDDEWSPKIPKWQNGNFNIKDFFLGKIKIKSQKLNQKEVEIILPEGSYEGIASQHLVTHSRSRWFSKSWVRTQINVEEGIPHPGKGTEAYNCGDDATYSISVPYGDIEKACKHYADTVLDYRERYPL